MLWGSHGLGAPGSCGLGLKSRAHSRVRVRVVAFQSGWLQRGGWGLRLRALGGFVLVQIGAEVSGQVQGKGTGGCLSLRRCSLPDLLCTECWGFASAIYWDSNFGTGVKIVGQIRGKDACLSLRRCTLLGYRVEC